MAALYSELDSLVNGLKLISHRWLCRMYLHHRQNVTVNIETRHPEGKHCSHPQRGVMQALTPSHQNPTLLQECFILHNGHVFYASGKEISSMREDLFSARAQSRFAILHFRNTVLLLK